MRIQKTFLGFVLMLNLVLNSGCFAVIIGAAAGAGGVAYIRGILVQNVDQDINRVHDAVIDSAKKLGLLISSDVLNVHSAIIKGSYSDGKTFVVNLDALTEHATKIAIRIGVFGDEARSRTILNTIMERL